MKSKHSLVALVLYCSVINVVAQNNYGIKLEGQTQISPVDLIYSSDSPPVKAIKTANRVKSIGVSGFYDYKFVQSLDLVFEIGYARYRSDYSVAGLDLSKDVNVFTGRALLALEVIDDKFYFTLGGAFVSGRYPRKLNEDFEFTWKPNQRLIVDGILGIEVRLKQIVLHSRLSATFLPFYSILFEDNSNARKSLEVRGHGIFTNFSIGWRFKKS